jgi:hypothetical protein
MGKMPRSQLWVLPVGAEPLGRDGDQLFYGNEDGLGSATPVGGQIVDFDFQYLKDAED